MKKKEVIKELNRLVKKVFEEFRFQPYETPYEAGWIKKNENGDVHYIGLGYIPRVSIHSGKQSSFQIEPDLVISIKEIEKYYAQITLNKSLRYDIDWRTLTARIGLIEGYPDGIINGNEHFFCNWIAHDLKDLESISSKVIDIFLNVAIPYIEKNANVPAVDKLLNENLDKTIVHSPSWPIRGIKGLIAGRLVGRNNLNELMVFYDSVLQSAPSKFQLEYAAVKNLIKTI